MRKEARKILFEMLKFQGAEEVLFSTGKITDQSALIETVIDAMEKFKNLHIPDVVGQSEQLFCQCKRPAIWETDDGFNGCVKCNKEVKAK